MTRRSLVLVLAVVGLSVGTGLSFVPTAQRAVRPGGDLPSHLADQEFWGLSTDASEADGYFRSDNLTSNELWFQRVVPDLMKRATSGGVYLGVGPEQNFTYMAAVRPAMAVIFDIRRGNMLVHLMYKALFELAADRVEFVSLLFSRLRPTALGASSSADELFAKFATELSSEVFYEQNLKRIEYHLTRTHAFPLSAKDLAGIEYVYNSFHQYGFAVRPWPTYAALMTETDGTGTNRSYLASEESFALLKKLEAGNLVIPVVGDFGGPRAIRTIGTYLKAHGATVSAFYLSNVEQYLFQDGKWTAFCRNVAALPLDSSSTFIRSSSRGGFGRFVSSLGNMGSEVRSCSGAN